jgi:hypothetical protein
MRAQQLQREFAKFASGQMCSEAIFFGGGQAV